MRIYDEDVEVRCADEAGMRIGSGGRWGPEAPAAFVWRGRLYLVRAVLDRWVERRPWWRTALDPAPGGGRHGVAVAEIEEDLWRVEASPGRMLRTGVFELARAAGAGPGGGEAGGSGGAREGGEPRWRLRRVAD